MKCTIEQQKRIQDLIEYELAFSTNPTKESIEAKIKNSGEGNVTLSDYLSSITEEELNNLVGYIEYTGFNPSDFITNNKIKIYSSNHAVLPNFFIGHDVLELFHGQPHVKAKFINWVQPQIASAVLIGSKTSKTYVKNDLEVSTNVNIMKQEAFNNLVAFLYKHKKLKSKDLVLFETGSSVNYENYILVMKAAESYFLNKDIFPKTSTTFLAKKEIPFLPLDLNFGNNKIMSEAFFSMILLNNFDYVLNQLGTGITTDFSYLGTFNSGKTPKYKKKIKGLHTDYWSADTHDAESSDSHEDDLTKLLISSIVAYRKDGETVDGMMETKQFYLLGARIYKFELENYGALKAEFKDFTPFNQNSTKSLDFYIDLITGKRKFTTDENSRQFQKLFEVRDILLSLKNFFEDNNINEKEANSANSVKSIITQIINNNRGAQYLIYNSNGILETKEMSNFDFQVTSFNTWSANKIESNLKELYNVSNEEVKKELDGLVSESKNTLLKNISDTSKLKVGKFLKKRFSSILSADAFDLMVQDMQKKSTSEIIKFETVGHLMAELTKLLADAYSDYDAISEVKKQTTKVFGDISTAQAMPTVTKNRLFIAYRTGWLENYVIRPQMNIDTLTGEKIPTFKIANLTYKDLELFEVHELNKRPTDTFKSIFTSETTGQGALLGTQTKLEAVSPERSRNKSASKFNVTENFKSNFLFDFLKQISYTDENKPSSFGIMLGNYSDKGTILLKTISANYVHNNKKVISNTDAELKELVRSQGAAFYFDATYNIIKDYLKVFTETKVASQSVLKSLQNISKNSTASQIIEAFNLIDSVLATLPSKNLDIYKLNALYKLSGNNSPLAEEQHYTSYKNTPLSTNRQLLSTFVLYSSTSNFNKFAKRIEDSFIQDFKDYIDDSGTFKVPDEISSEFKNLLKADKLNTTLGSFWDSKNQVLKVSNSKGEINPLIQKWLWLNALYRNEYLFISAKGEYMHPHKNGSEYIDNIDLSDNFWDKYDMETSGRLISMAKRNVLFTATIETPVRNSQYGIPDKINHAVIKDYTTSLTNISGSVKSKQDVHDGSSMIDYVYSKMVDNSYPGKGYEGTKKPFGTFITPNGVVIKKDAESVITNWNILASNNAAIKLKDKKKQMLGLTIPTIQIQPFALNFATEDYYYKKGKDIIQITSVSIVNDPNSGELIYTIRQINTSTGQSYPPITKNLVNLYNLWEDLGAEYSSDAEGNFTEASNELLYRLVTNVKDTQNNYFLKDYIIHIISNASAVKAGGIGVNSSLSWTDSKALNYSTHESRFLGIQLDANHEADNAKIKEITQVISALSQGRDTFNYANSVYNDIAKIIENAAQKYSKYIKDWSSKPQEVKSELYQFLARKFARDIQNTKGDTLAKVITQSFSNVGELPFSNQNFFVGFVKTIITDLNNNFISRYYSGTGAILLPSHGIIKLYDLPVTNADGTISYTQVMHNDLVKLALNNSEPSNLSNDQIVQNYINSVLKDEDISADKVRVGDTVKVLTEVDDIDLEGVLPEDVSVTMIDKPWNDDPSQSNVAYNFTLNSKPTEIFQLVKDKEENYYSVHFKTSERTSLTNDEKAKLIYSIYSQLPSGAKLSTRGNITKGGIAGLSRFKEFMQESRETREVKLNGKTIKIPVLEHTKTIKEVEYTLDNPVKYYDFKKSQAGNIVKKVNSVPRDLKPAEFSWDTTTIDASNTLKVISQTAFDLDSVRLRLELKFNTISDLDKDFVNKLKVRFNNLDIDKVLIKWTQRNLQLLEKGKILKSLDELRIVNNWSNDQIISHLFSNDDLLKSFNNVENHYLDSTVSNGISNYKFTAAELILGNLYKSTFDIDDTLSMSEIKTQGSNYFYNKLKTKFDVTVEDESSNFKLLSESGEEIYVKYTKDNIVNDKNTIKIESEPDALDPIKINNFIRDRNGDKLFSFESDFLDNVRVKNEDGKITIYLKAYNKDFVLQKDFVKKLTTFILNNKRNIKYLVPIEKSSTENIYNLQSYKSNKVQKIKSTDITNQLFNTLVGKDYLSIDEALKDMSNKIYASWEKSHEFVAARIPAQSMQSFMPMKNVAYFNTKSNDAYVSVWQIWFQGSDFDIDKAYLLGSGIGADGIFETTNVFNYNTSEELNVIENMPMPSGNTVFLDKNGVDLTQDFETFIKYSAGKLSQLEYLKMMDRVLTKILSNQGIYISNIKDSTKLGLEQFLNIIDSYNTNKEYLKSRYIVKNSVVSKIKKIISSPSNQVFATSPVDEALDDWKNSVKNKDSIQKSKKLTPYNMLSMFKQQYDAAVGKDDVGISANGLKVFFALSDYYNNYYSTQFTGKDLQFDNHIFKKQFTINGKQYSIGGISDINLLDSQKNQLMKTLQLDDSAFRNSDAAMFLSGFTSAATDNAKELLMAKVNASVELASMHIYLMIFGFTPEQIVDIMTSDIATEIIANMSDDIFIDDNVKLVPTVIQKIRSKIDKTNTKKLDDLNAFEQIYNGAQEVKYMAKLLGVNQKTSANTYEVHKFLSTFEKIIFSRENIIFGKTLDKIKEGLATVNEVNKKKLNPTLFEKTLTDMATKIIASSNRFSEKDLKKIKDILKEASNITVEYINSTGEVTTREVSILGGEFDYRYYIHPSDVNNTYREATIKYYNLIKDTFNIFDVINSVPHFKSMIDALSNSHHLLSLSSFKYNAIFNLLKDASKKYSDKLISKNNNNVKTMFGNEAFPIVLNQSHFNGALLYVDTMLKDAWLKSSKFGKTIDFPINTIKDYMKKAGVKTFKVYTADEAYASQSSEMKTISTDESYSNFDDTFTINLNTIHGVANFKNFMEKVLLKVLSEHSSSNLKDLLNVGSIKNLLGLNSSTIMTSFKITDKNNPATAAKLLEVINIFNELDQNTNPNLQLEPGLSWIHLFYVYNLIFNNEKYGDKRLTPILEDYIKDSNSAGNDFIKFSYKLDSGEESIFKLDESLVITQDAEGNSLNKTQKEIQEEAKEIKMKDFLLYAFGKNGQLYWNNNSTGMSIQNPDFSFVHSIATDTTLKKDNYKLKTLRDLLSKNNFLIQFKCE